MYGEVSARDREEAERIYCLMRARDRFYRAYCRRKGWPEAADELSMDQIMEIRSQDGWKRPLED